MRVVPRNVINVPIFVIKFSGVSDLQRVKVPVFPLTWLVIVTTVLRYRAACDITECFVHFISVEFSKSFSGSRIGLVDFRYLNSTQLSDDRLDRFRGLITG